MPSLSSLALSWRSGAGPSPRPTVSNGHAKLWPELHVGDSISCSVYALKSQVSLWACSLTLPCLPLMCHVVSGVLDAVFSSQLGRGPPHFPPPPSWGFSESKLYPLPQDPFLVHRQGVCMRVHAAGAGAVSVCPLSLSFAPAQ